MKLPALLNALYHRPALITPAAHAAVRQLIEHRLEHNATPLAREPGIGVCGEEIEVDQMEIIDGVAHIPIAGIIGQDLSPFQRGDGCVDTLDIRDELDQADLDTDVRGAILHIGSPGGMILGTPETADRIADFTKPIFVFSRSQVCSAAYWIAAACDAIYTTRTADVGSIGVYLPVFDYSEMFKQAGVTVELIKSGKLKGIGYPGTSLSESAKEYLQKEINDIYATFARHVRDTRGENVTDDTMQGQSFMAPEALERGLIDGIVRDLSEVTALI